MSDKRPQIHMKPGGQGVQQQRDKVPMSDQRPFMQNSPGGQGVSVQRKEVNGTGRLSSPFPYYGGKSRWIDLVFARIGKVGVWSEPCCGTAVMTLNNPEPAPREVICDLNAFICNFYRSLVGDYEQSAYWADWPTNHHDLTARHRWLLAQGPELRERMVADPHDYDPKIAGYWCWGQSSWIGHGWCDGTNWEQVPNMPGAGGHKGVQMQRVNLPVEDKRPKVPDGGGSGVSAQRDRVPGEGMPCVQVGGGRGVQQQRVSVPDKIPLFSNSASGLPSGSGVQIQRRGFQGDNRVRLPEGDGVLDGSRLRPWFRAIAERLARCIILNRGWEWALTDSVLQQTPSSPKPQVGVFLDPPYRTQRKDGGKRSTGLYQGDNAAASDAVAAATYAWALEHGDKYRVVYCMHEGDFPIPPGWTAETMGFSGHRDPAKKEKAVDQVMFSPACVPVPTDPQLGFGW